MSNAENQTPIEADIPNGQKMRVSNVRINGDIIGADGKTATVGAGLELGAEQLAALGSAAVQALARRVGRRTGGGGIMEGMEILGATGAGAAVGGALTWISSMRKESHERQMAMIDKMRETAKDADESADKAARATSRRSGSA